jgi:hypothetical protein
MPVRVVLKEDKQCFLCARVMPVGTKAEREAHTDDNTKTGKKEVTFTVAHWPRCPNDTDQDAGIPLTDAMRYTATGSYGMGKRR